MPAALGRKLESDLSRLAARQHGVVGACQLTELGFSRTQIDVRVAQGRLHRLHAGVYAVGHPAVTREGRWMAAVLAAGPAAVLSHRDAAALWDLADLTRPTVEVTLPGLGSRSRSGIRIHRTRRLDERDRTTVHGIPVTSVERLMVDMATAIPLRHLRSVYVEARRRDVVDLEVLDRAVEDGRGRRGIWKLRRIRAEDSDALARTRSPLEVEFLDFCREQGLPEPRVNVWVGGYLVDAYWPEANLVVELDGFAYHSDRESFERDRAKIGDLRLAGIAVLPVTRRRLRGERARVAAAIREALGEAARGEADIPSKGGKNRLT